VQDNNVFISFISYWANSCHKCTE